MLGEVSLSLGSSIPSLESSYPKNPNATRTRAAQERFSVNVWAGIVGDHLVGPYLLPERLTGANYLIFLQQVLQHLLDDTHVSAAMRSPMWFQHDGAHAQYSIDLRLHLNATYGQQWIRRDGPVLWPARSPDFTALITSYGGTSSHLCTKLSLTVLRTLLRAARELLRKSGTRPVFSLTFDLQCAGHVRHCITAGDVISNTYFDDDRCLLNVLFS
ncbi:hypothetical protein AVEN_243700-1 [Araneus ventricosus]|uniref:Uncharacterized protein n=1 Tax=Araneus ventricosus TaxID=182803 RepID=A0A4Y2A4W6_ARAVE|nr:hypothetical protein AVEN_243700-1 [Araneus ventricosus]